MNFKVLVMGFPGVGKTKLIRRWLDSTYCDEQDEDLEEREIKIFTKHFHRADTLLFIEMWDIPGSSSVPVSPTAFNDVDGTIIVCDLTNAQSLNSVKIFADLLKGLYPTDRKTTSKTPFPIFVFANKCDAKRQHISLDILSQEVAELELEDGYPMSARTGLNVDIGFRAFLDVVIPRKLQALQTSANKKRFLQSGDLRGIIQKLGGPGKHQSSLRLSHARDGVAQSQTHFDSLVARQRRREAAQRRFRGAALAGLWGRRRRADDAGEGGEDGAELTIPHVEDFGAVDAAEDSALPSAMLDAATGGAPLVDEEAEGAAEGVAEPVAEGVAEGVTPEGEIRQVESEEGVDGAAERGEVAAGEGEGAVGARAGTAGTTGSRQDDEEIAGVAAPEVHAGAGCGLADSAEGHDGDQSEEEAAAPPGTVQIEPATSCEVERRDVGDGAEKPVPPPSDPTPVLPEADQPPPPQTLKSECVVM